MSDRLDGSPLWFHGASVGDARALGPLLGAVGAHAGPGASFLTVGRAAGRTAARGWYPELPIREPPWPLFPAPGRFLHRTGARLLILEYLELWPAVMAACARLNVPVVIVDGRVSARSLRVRAFLSRAAGRVDLFCAQSEADAEAALRLGVRPECVHVTGNAKHDGPSEPPFLPDALEQSLGAFDLVLGSLHRSEEAAACAALRAFPGRVLIAPRDPSRASALVARARALGVEIARRSAGPSRARWVVLDTVGELAAAWGLGRCALVGGTFCHREGQNLVEAARHGLPIIHGPRIANIRAEASVLQGAGATCVPTWSEAVALACALLRGDETSADPRVALTSLRGAVERQMAHLRPFLDAAVGR